MPRQLGPSSAIGHKVCTESGMLQQLVCINLPSNLGRSAFHSVASFKLFFRSLHNYYDASYVCIGLRFQALHVAIVSTFSVEILLQYYTIDSDEYCDYPLY